MSLNTEQNIDFGITVNGDLNFFGGSDQNDDDTSAKIGNSSVPITCNIPMENLYSSSLSFGNVTIKESNNTHFGNNTYFNGPVIIKQISQNGNGTVNPSFTRTEDDIVPQNYDQPITLELNSCRKLQIQVWNKLTLSVLCIFIMLLGGIFTVFSVYLSNSSSSKHEMKSSDYNDETAAIESASTTSTNVPLLIAPGHLRIVSRSDWLAQPVESKYLAKLSHPVPWVIISHTATESCSNQSQCVLRVRLIQTFHIESRKWHDIGYNFLVGGDGSAYCGRGWDSVGAHTLGYNNFAIGISFIGTFNNNDPPKEQLEACRKLIKRGVDLGKIAKDYKLFGHRQLSSTLSPGDKLFEIIVEWPHFVSDFTNLTDLIPNYS